MIKKTLNRIAFLVTRSDQIGGSHIHVKDMAIALKKKGYHVRIFIGGEGPVVNYYEDADLTVVSIRNMKRNIAFVGDVKAYFELKREIRSFDPDIITTHSSKAGFLGRVVAWNLAIPVIFTVHGWAFTDGKSVLKKTIYRWLEKMVVPITDKIISVSDYDRMLGIKKLGLPESKIQTVYNGMPDIDRQKLAQHSDKKPVIIVMVARFDQPKDQIELLKATYDIEDLHIHFVGDGPLREETVRLAKELNVHNRVKFWGQVDDVDNILSKAQIFALISNWEGFPLSTLEAMRAGLPTVVSDVGGAAEAVNEGVTGYSVPKGDVKKTHAVIKDLVENDKKRKSMGIAARKSFEQNYMFEQMYLKTVKIYEDVLKSNNQ